MLQNSKLGLTREHRCSTAERCAIQNDVARLDHDQVAYHRSHLLGFGFAGISSGTRALSLSMAYRW